MAHLPRIFVLREEAHVMRLRGLFDSRGSFGVVRSPMHLFERGRQSKSNLGAFPFIPTVLLQFSPSLL